MFQDDLGRLRIRHKVVLVAIDHHLRALIVCLVPGLVTLVERLVVLLEARVVLDMFKLTPPLVDPVEHRFKGDPDVDQKVGRLLVGLIW